MNDIKHIRRDFHSTAWVMPEGWDFGVVWGLGGQHFFFLKFNKSWYVSYLHEWHMQQHNFLGSSAPGAFGRSQRSNIITSQLLSQFQFFLNQTLCVFSQMKDIEHIRRDFHWAPWVMPKGLGLGGTGGQKINFLSKHGHGAY